EIGYVLNPSYWGMGIAPEAVSAVLRFGFTELHLHRIEARYMTGNTASRRVMEKVGMTYEGTARESMFVKGDFVSVGTCAILRSEYFGK
ncbi:MAG: GNAT family N-acetyltransferase, partial [Clostridia bacterium]|nr:GNAT family N-acetyltransferase [Clostridia bacterium]